MPPRLLRNRSLLSALCSGMFAGAAIGYFMLAALLPATSLAQQTLADVNNQSADTSALQSQIDSTNTQIQKLQQEITQLQSQLTTTTKQKQTLQNAITALNLNIKKLQTSITLTQAQINQKDSQIQVLGTTIATTTGAVAREQTSAADSLRQLDALDNESVILTLLAGGTLSSFFDQAVQIADLQTALQHHIQALASLKNNLETAKSATEDARTQLSGLKQSLGSQQSGLVTARSAQTELLTTTKNKESNYQALLAQKKQEEAQFESQLNDFQSKLKGVGPGGVPPSGPRLAWPLTHIIITQYFGNTAFATQNPQIYNGHGHSGIDLGASPGTPVMAAAEGTVMGTGNTDTVCPYASFGKWIFIKHPNGLGTLYAHLGTIGVSQGQSVTQGQVIGYSDTTGYATGPHLHFGVYVASSVTIERLPTALKCPLIIPIAPLSGYLNPLSYLPAPPQ